MSIKKLKNQAKNCLKNNNWGKAIGMSVIIISIFIALFITSRLLYMIFNINNNDGIIFNFISNNFNFTMNYVDLSIVRVILYFLIFMLSPIWLGFNRWCLLTARGENVPVYELFYYFIFGERYFNSLAVYAKSVLKIIIVGIICIVPGFLFMGHGINLLINNISYLCYIILFLSIIILICGIIATFLFMSRYSLAGYIYILKPECSPKKCVKLSVMLTTKYKNDYIKLYCSNVKYIVLGLLILPLIFVIPYCKMTSAVMADEIISKNGNK